MCKRVLVLVFAFASAPLFTARAGATEDDLHMEVLPVPAASKASVEDNTSRAYITADPEWHTWCPSVIRGDDGKYHMFHSRWPRKATFSGWLVASEIAHAVADKPEGPYHYVETALGSRGKYPWNAITAHNSKIERFDGKYYLYFCATHGETDEAKLTEIAHTGFKHAQWMPIRNNLRTGVAVADSLSRPWQVCDKPIVEPAGPIARLTVNAAVSRGPEGTYFMILKGDKPGEQRFQRNQALATARTPDGPFTIQPKPVIDDIDTEDVSMWYDRKRSRFYAVFHAHTFIGMVTSTDGYNWIKAVQYKITTPQVRFDDGTIWRVEQMQRPFVLADDQGQPQWLFVAVKNGDRSYDVAMPLQSTSK
jgi:hypothetical protein